MKNYDEMVSSIRFYRTVTAVLVGCIVYIGMNNISTTEVAKEYKAKYEVSERSAHLRIEQTNQEKSNRIAELEEANEALIKVCRPDMFRKAAKNTQLPKMKEA